METLSDSHYCLPDNLPFFKKSLHRAPGFQNSGRKPGYKRTMRKKPCDDLTGYKWFHVGIVHCIRYFPYTRRYFTGYFAQHCFRISGAGNNRIESFFIPASTSHKRKTEEILSGRYVFTYSLQIIIPYILKEKNMGLPRRFFQDRQDFFGMEIICRNDDILKIIVG